MKASAAFTAFSFICSTPPSLLRASLPKGRASERSLKALMHAAIARVAELEEGGAPRDNMTEIRRKVVMNTTSLKGGKGSLSARLP